MPLDDGKRDAFHHFIAHWISAPNPVPVISLRQRQRTVMMRSCIIHLQESWKLICHVAAGAFLVGNNFNTHWILYW